MQLGGRGGPRGTELEGRGAPGSLHAFSNFNFPQNFILFFISGCVGCVPTPKCDFNGAGSNYTRTRTDEDTRLFASFGEGAVIELVSFMGPPYFGPEGEGIYDLAGINYADCGLCLRAFRECDEDYSCTEAYYADIGTIHLNSAPYLSGEMYAVVFTESTFDPETLVNTPATFPKRWCIEEFKF